MLALPFLRRPFKRRRRWRMRACVLRLRDGVQLRSYTLFDLCGRGPVLPSFKAFSDQHIDGDRGVGFGQPHAH
jgi:hypothetical protein